MIRPIQITLNAAHPELPLIEASTYVGSPSTAFVRGVPAAIGNWKITAVRVIFHYPDESVVAAACVNSATGVWVGTIAPTATSGRVANGYQVLADGTDENGDAVTGYVLGMGDLAVYTRDMTIDAGETVWYLHYFDVAPTTPKKGDVAPVDGALKYYNGTAWESFAAGITLDDAVTRTSANGVKSSGIWAAIWGAHAALPTGFASLYDWCVSQLAGKASTADATLTERGFSEWTFVPATFERDGETYEWSDYAPRYEPVQFEYEGSLYNPGWYGFRPDGEQGPWEWTGDGPNALTLTTIAPEGGEVAATRTALPGYQLGSQSAKPLASEAEAEAIRTAVAGKLASSDVIDPASATASGKAADALATKNALAARPTKSQIDEGWWSDWTILRDSVDVTAQVAQPSYDETEGEWLIGLVSGDDIGMPYTQGGPDATALSWIAYDSGHNAVTYTATRHRVAAPVPTKPEDIGAASRAADPTAGHLAALDSNGNPVDSGNTPADFMPADAKIQRIYNAGGTDALDDKGQLFKSALETGGHWEVEETVNGVTTHKMFYYDHGSGGNQVFWYQQGTSSGIFYTPWTGSLSYNALSPAVSLTPNAATNLDPTIANQSAAMGGVYTHTGDSKSVVAKYVPMSAQIQTTPYAHLALESLPDRTWAAGAWAVGDLVKYDGKAYRCKAAATSSDTTAPSSDPTHWDEIPVLAQKADDSAIAPEFSASSTYAVDAVVMHEGTRYRCTTAVTTAGAWDSTKWTAETVQTAIENGGGGGGGGIPAGAHAVYINSQGQLCYDDGE